MVRLLFILILLPLSTLAQSGRYRINTKDVRDAEGYITITESYIRLEEDSTTLTLPVVDHGRYRNSTYYVLEGCVEGTAIRGAGIYTEGHTENMTGGRYRYHSALYIELRARQRYISVRYTIFYDQ